jgi:hypothetical protein
MEGLKGIGIREVGIGAVIAVALLATWAAAGFAGYQAHQMRTQKKIGKAIALSVATAALAVVPTTIVRGAWKGSSVVKRDYT